MPFASAVEELSRQRSSFRYKVRRSNPSTRAAHTQLAGQAGQHGISTSLDVAPEIEGLELMCDSERLSQVLAQLGAGALRVVPEKGIIASRVDVDGDAAIRFQVRSSSAEGVERDATLPRVDAPKLPLALARGLIELHGGRIDASRNDDSVTFAFTIPRTQPQ